MIYHACFSFCGLTKSYSVGIFYAKINKIEYFKTCFNAVNGNEIGFLNSFAKIRNIHKKNVRNSQGQALGDKLYFWQVNECEKTITWDSSGPLS